MTTDDGRAAALKRIKLMATLLLVGTAALFGIARYYEPTHWAWGYVASFAAAATVGGLAGLALHALEQGLKLSL